MTAPTVARRPTHDILRRDRPGWIPEWVGDDWDPDPYAYQTEEELLPEGYYHSLYLHMLAEMLAPHLARLNLRLAIDVFLFYRDWEDRKQRVAADAFIAPHVELDPAALLSSYNLDVEPLPICVVEVTSPRSRTVDRDSKVLFYAWLGIYEYLLLDIVDDDERPLEQIGVSLWRLEERAPVPVEPDTEGYVTLDSMGVRIKAEGRRLIAQVVSTGEFLRTTTELTTALEAAEQRAEAEAAARREAEQHAEAETAARREAEAELARLREELARLRGDSS